MPGALTFAFFFFCSLFRLIHPPSHTFSEPLLFQRCFFGLFLRIPPSCPPATLGQGEFPPRFFFLFCFSVPFPGFICRSSCSFSFSRLPDKNDHLRCLRFLETFGLLPHGGSDCLVMGGPANQFLPLAAGFMLLPAYVPHGPFVAPPRQKALRSLSLFVRGALLFDETSELYRTLPFGRSPPPFSLSLFSGLDIWIACLHPGQVAHCLLEVYGRLDFFPLFPPRKEFFHLLGFAPSGHTPLFFLVQPG